MMERVAEGAVQGRLESIGVCHRRLLQRGLIGLQIAAASVAGSPESDSVVASSNTIDMPLHAGRPVRRGVMRPLTAALPGSSGFAEEDSHCGMDASYTSHYYTSD